MAQFYTVKRIDNSRVVRSAGPRRLRECAKLAGMCGALALLALLYAWQHFQYIQLSYKMEQLRAEQAQAAELNQKLKLDVASLRSPVRIDAIARRELGLTAPVPGQVLTVSSLGDGSAIAQVRRVSAPPTP